MAIITKQKYTQEKIDKLFDYLKLYKDKGMAIDYEILIDGFKAVRRTSDPEMFTMFESFVAPDSKAIEILFYTGSSNNNDKHIFTFNDQAQEKELSGIEIDNRIQEGIQREKRSWEFDSLKKENKELKEEITELEEEIEKLEKHKLDYASEQSPLKGLLGEVGSTLVETFIRRNPKLLSKIPGGETLAGLMEEDHREDYSLDENNQNGQVSFKAAASGKSLSEEDQYAISFVNQLKTSFSKPEFDKVLEILEHYATSKESIDHMLSIIKSTP